MYNLFPVPRAERSPSGFPVQSGFPVVTASALPFEGMHKVFVEREGGGIYNQLHLLFGFFLLTLSNYHPFDSCSTFSYSTCKYIFYTIFPPLL